MAFPQITAFVRNIPITEENEPSQEICRSVEMSTALSEVLKFFNPFVEEIDMLKLPVFVEVGWQPEVVMQIYGKKVQIVVLVSSISNCPKDLVYLNPKSGDYILMKGSCSEHLITINFRVFVKASSLLSKSC